MRYGVLYNKYNVNIGDDIQAYATSRFLPSVDYFIDREHIDEFETDNKKAVGVIMNAWYMWAKWNWPPSKYIYPHFVGFHYADHQLAKQPGTHIKYEFLEGLGGEYLKSYGPIGCRDKFTMKNLQDLEIESYFSGCITLTLEKQPETEDKGTYICLVDLEPKVRKKLQAELEAKGIEVRIFTHTRERDGDMSWEDRVEFVKERLKIYQNAKCVVTKKLHCSLPCLAMEVPVFLIKEMEDDIRFDPYNDLLYRSTVTNFMNDNYEYDFLNPPKNKDDYKKVRDFMIKSCEEFVEKTKNMDDDPDTLNKTKYTNVELLKWRHDTMKQSMDQWLQKNRDQLIEIKSLGKSKEKLEIKVEKKTKALEEKKEKIKQKNAKIKELKNKLKEKEALVKKYEKIIKDEEIRREKKLINRIKKRIMRIFKK